MKKIDVKKSTIYRRDRREDLSKCVFLLGGQGYFSDDDDFSTYEYGTLVELRCWMPLSNHPFVKRNNGEGMWYKYFIPEESIAFEEVEEPKKKVYRPYKDFAEFANHMGLRDSNEVQFIEFRSKNCSNRYNLAYNGYEVDKFGVAYIHLGSLTFTFDELFNNYEYELNSFEYIPFGVLENEKD